MSVYKNILIFVFITNTLIFGVREYFMQPIGLFSSSRMIGMGNAAIATSNEGNAIFTNPAGMIQIKNVEILGSTTLNRDDNDVMDNKLVVYRYKDFAMGWGNKLNLPEPKNDFSYYSFAYKINHRISLGISTKFTRKSHQTRYQYFGHNPTIDFGILLKPIDNLAIGITAYNHVDFNYIDEITIGAAYQIFDNMLIASDINYITYNDTLRNKLNLFIGTEYNLFKNFFVRAGLSEGKFTYGIGIKYKIIRLDYAIYYNAIPLHQLSFAFNWN